MKRVEQMQLYRLGSIAALREIRTGKDPDQTSVRIAYEAQNYLQHFQEDELLREMAPAATQRAQSLFELLKGVQEYWLETGEIDSGVIYGIQLALQRFETSLDDDLSRANSYVVERTAAYSSDQLISSADNAFSSSVKVVLPEQAIRDFRAAGACLVFEQYTACGFHAFRAVDAMLRKYSGHFCKPLAGTARDWGKYIGALRAAVTDAGTPKKPNLRTVELLDSIRSMDRNPLIHPELNLDSGDALHVFDLSKNTLSLMAIDIKNNP
jgi:hypothetical protein